MKIEKENNNIILWANDKKEEKFAEKIRTEFDNNKFITDRLIDKREGAEGKPLGIRVFIN